MNIKGSPHIFNYNMHAWIILCRLHSRPCHLSLRATAASFQKYARPLFPVSVHGADMFDVNLSYG